MLCRQCEQEASRLGPGRRTLPARRIQGSERLTGLLCERCGAVLPASQADDHLLKRLAQLSRFGIGAESAPLLADTGTKAD